jgi:tetratricopeptide (TPR) repeat protein
MSESTKGTRRGFKVAGEPVEQREEPTRVRPRTVDEAFRLARPDEEVEAPEGRVYPPHLLEAFLQGRITLGDLEGITKQEQYQMAEIGHGYLSQAKLTEARTVFEGLLALDPYDAYFNMALGSIAQQEHRNADALRFYDRALEINPFSPTAYANRGELRVMQGELQTGVEDLVKALELDPKMKEPATERARATILVLREQLTNLDQDELKRRAAQTTGSKVPVATARPSSQPSGPARAAPRPRAGPRGRAAPRSGARRPGPRRPGPRGK